jgi:sulfate adenylyltransferase
MVLSSKKLITPYGGSLVNLLIQSSKREELLEKAGGYTYIQLTPRQLFDLELLTVGAFSPLDRFMGQADYQNVLHQMKLVNGVVWPIPITLTIKKEDLHGTSDFITLRDAYNRFLAVMRIEEIYRFNWHEEAETVYETTDIKHPMISEMISWGDHCISGELRVLNLPQHDDFPELRMTPRQTRKRLEQMGNANVVAFQTRNPMHRVHEELTQHAARQVGGSLLIHPVVGLTNHGDVDHFTRVRIYKTLVDKYYDKQTLLSLLPLAMRMGGPREAVWHAIIRRNYGANHFIVGRDHASPGNDSQGKPFYGPYEAQELLTSFEENIGVKMIPFERMVYIKNEQRYEFASKAPEGAEIEVISGTKVRDEYLYKGVPLPAWFTRPETAQILLEAFPPRVKQGFCLWFTGLSGAGKTTISRHLVDRLREYGRVPTVLDGDVIRTHLSKGLGFNRKDRDTNILRIGFVASEIVKHNGNVITAAISPYRQARREARKMFREGSFIEIFVDTPLEVCEQRDTKGFYARARAGKIKNFTGIDDPYEVPIEPELHLRTVDCSPEANAQRIIDYLVSVGFISKFEPIHF